MVSKYYHSNKFQEWYEFTPYEVGIPKYGVFMNTKDFASKFYMGQKVKSFPEVRLHYMYGIWGSAFTILLKRLVQEKGRNGEKEVLKMVLGDSCPANSENTNLSCDTTSSSSAEGREQPVCRLVSQLFISFH